MLVYYIECHIILVFIGEVTLFYCYFVNIDFVNIYFQIAYVEYQILFDIYEVLTKACIYQFIVSLFLGRNSTLLYLFPISWTICSGGDL